VVGRPSGCWWREPHDPRVPGARIGGGRARPAPRGARSRSAESPTWRTLLRAPCAAARLHLKALSGVVGRTLPQSSSDQPVGRGGLVGMNQQVRQERALPAADDGDRPARPLPLRAGRGSGNP
jgi:hypothetical protein